jgi:hypothetical protein
MAKLDSSGVREADGKSLPVNNVVKRKIFVLAKQAAVPAAAEGTDEVRRKGGFS